MFFMRLKNWLVYSIILLVGSLAASAFTTNDAATAFTAYNNAFLQSGYYNGWWTGAEEIEMAEDAYDNSPTTARQTIVSNACVQFISHHGSAWYDKNNNFNNFNDDISWAVIAFSRGYQITGNTTFRNVAKFNWDAMYKRAWDTSFTGGGLWWNTDNTYKNAAVNGPAAIGACYLYSIYGDTNYLNKAQAIYAWERRVLVNTSSGSIADGINLGSTTTSGGALTYNQGTFIGAANFLYRATGLPFYYQDAILVGKYTQKNMNSDGILPDGGTSGDGAGFNSILIRWVARFAKDQNLWPAFGPWLTTNANAAWGFRNADNLVWENWRAQTPADSSTLNNWACANAVVIMQVADTTPADALQITPSAGFTAVSQSSLLPNPTSINLVLTNTGATTLNWSLANTSIWLNVSATTGTLAAGDPATIVQVSLVPAATTNLPAGRYYASLGLTNLASGAVQSRLFTLVLSAGSAPITATGYNAAMLAPNSATSGTPGATAFDIPNNYCFYQAGLNGSTRGLPPDGIFTSQLDTTTVFQFQPYGTANTLVMGSPYSSSATLTLATPQAYKTLAILACSANGGGLGTFILNFTNGTQSQVFNFNAQDWFGTTANVGIQAFGRLKLTSFGAEDNGASNPNMYQTTLDLASLGLTQAISSITFTKPASAATCGVFAISGIVVYQAPVITQQPVPANLYRFAGATNSWSVAVNAALPAYYNWCLNGNVIPTATNSTYQLASVQTNQSGNYTVIIGNSFGAVTSSIVSLTVMPAPAYPFGQAVLTDGPLGYWRLDEAGGPLAHDYLAANNGAYTPGVLLGQPGNKLLDTHTVARFGSLSTSNSCVTNIALDFATYGNSSAAFSVEAWVNGGTQTSDAGLVTKGYGNGGEQFNLDCGGGGHAFRFFVRDMNGGVHAATGSVTPNGQWHHLVGVCNEVNASNGYVSLYVDGVNVAQGVITNNYAPGILSSATPVSIGSRQSGLGTAYDNQFAGYVEEVAIYGYALSSSQVLTHYQSASNRAPAFLSNPFTVGNIIAGQSYSGTLAASASDPNGDAITFAKVSGPAWLSVAGTGSLGGTPISSDVGTNAFVMSATDPGGLSGTATMNLPVLAAPPIITSAVMQGTDLMLNWGGGIAPYQVQWTTNLSNPSWQNLGTSISASNLLVSPTNGAAFYRIYGQ
jgi:predicted alpha-1,6-mannanase (GH76 family)